MRRVREAIGISRREMTTRLRMGVTEYVDLEEGRRPFTCAYALRIFRRIPGLYATGVCLSDLLEGVPDAEPGDPRGDQ